MVKVYKVQLMKNQSKQQNPMTVGTQVETEDNLTKVFTEKDQTRAEYTQGRGYMYT